MKPQNAVSGLIYCVAAILGIGLITFFAALAEFVWKNITR